MKKATPKRVKSQKSVNSKVGLVGNHKALVAIILIALTGTALVLAARAATRVSDQLLGMDNLAISYQAAQPSSAEQEGGKVRIISRPRAIDVSKDGFLFCTPQNDGDITRRQLNDDEIRAITKEIQANRPLITDDIGSGGLVSDQAILYVGSFDGTISADIYYYSDQPNFIDSSAQLLEELCVVDGQPVSDDSIWELYEVGGQQASGNIRLVTLVSPPRVEAGGQPGPAPTVSSGNYHSVDSAAEIKQTLLMTETRNRHGVMATQRTTCLDSAAREWASTMALSQFLRHTSPINRLPEKYCGAGWTRLGENVGRVGLSLPNDQKHSEQRSAVMFDAYMKSPGHKANIIDPRYTHHGIGAYKTGDGKMLYSAQIFWAGKSLPK